MDESKSENREIQPVGIALRRSEERFRLLVEGVKDYAIFMLDPEGRVSSWNEGARRIKGYEPHEILGQHFSKFYAADALATNWPEHELEAAQRDGRFEDEGWRIRKDGTRFWANVVITPLYGEDGTLRGYAKVTRDLTERRLNESLVDANRRMNEFLAMVSHELRTPLNAMLGWIRLLRGGHLDAETIERGLATIERNTVVQARLIEDLLDVSRIVSGNLRLSIESVDLAVPLLAALDAVRLSANAKGVVLETDVPSNTAIVMGDAARLQQIVWNLLSNAIKFTPTGGTVRLELEHVRTSAQVVVRDTGRGIEPDFLPYVFDRFRQADASTTREHGGLGLGLAIVKHLVEAHGGTVYAESDGVDLGATFVVRIPTSAEVISARRDADTGPPMALGALEVAGTGFDRARILVVDDEEDARDMLALLLGECDAEVRTASSVREAMAIFENWPVDVLISDLGMPDEDGHELIRQVRALPAHEGGTVPAIALTAYARVEDRLRALQAGFQMHVPKPVEPAELVSVVRSLLDFRASMRTPPGRTS